MEREALAPNVSFDEETRRADTFATTTTYQCNEWLDEVDIKRYEDLYHTIQDVQELFAMASGALLKG